MLFCEVEVWPEKQWWKILKSDSWLISFNVYVWSLKMYRSSSLKSEHVWKVPNTACFKDRLHLQYLSRFFFEVIEHPAMENHTWNLFSLVFTFPSISSNLKKVFFSCGSCFVQHEQWTIKRLYSCLGRNNGMFILPSYFFGVWLSPNLSIPGGFCTKRKLVNPTWRIIPVSKCLVTTIYKPFLGSLSNHNHGKQPYVGRLV